jgi:RNA polymerase sigma-70 factor (ECF subfamily)
MDLFQNASDGELVARTRAGQRDAYGELVRRHQSAVYNIAYRLVGERQTALDLTQEAFVRAFRALDSFDRARPFAPWLHRIATNAALNWLERKRVPTVPLERDNADRASEIPDESHEPERVVIASEQNARVRRAILGLPPRQRAVIELRHFQDLSYDEIATALGIPLSNVKSDLFRARQALRQTLASEI